MPAGETAAQLGMPAPERVAGLAVARVEGEEATDNDQASSGRRVLIGEVRPA